MKPDFFQRSSGRVLLVLACLVPIIAWGSLYVYQNKNNSVLEWLPWDFPATTAYNEFLDVFGSNESVLISWDGCTVDDPRLGELARVIKAHDQEDGEQWFSDVTTGPQALAQVEDSAGVPRAEAVRRLEGVLIGPDRQTTCALITLQPLDDQQRAAAVAWLHQTAASTVGLPQDDIRLTGDAVIGVALDYENERAINTWIYLAMGLALVLAWQSLRSLKLGLIVMVVGGFASSLCEALVYYTGGTMNMLLTLVPVLMFVLAISGSVHLANYYRDALDEFGAATAPAHAFNRGWKPCLFASVTSALGLGSLCVSHVMPVWSFGFYAAISILLVLGVLLYGLPAALTKFPLPARPAERIERVGAWQQAYVNGVLRYRAAVIAVVLILMFGLGAGLSRLETEVKPSRFLSPQSKWIQDTNWFTEHLGPFQSVEVLLTFDQQAPPELGKRLAAARDVDQKLARLDLVRGTYSTVTLLPDSMFDQNRGGLLSFMQQRVMQQQFRKQQANLENAGVLAERNGREIWRISLRVAQFNSGNYAEFLGQVRQAAESGVQQAGAADKTEITLTGAIPLLFSAQDELLQGLAESFVLAFAMIALVLAALLKSVRAGLLCMLPNVFPAAVVFGTLGWMGRAVDVGSMMTASVALGIAVDDTIHYLTWFRRYFDQGLSQREAVCRAFSHCVAPILQTSIIIGCSFGVFYFSTFRPVSQFGVLMLALLFAALLGDLVLLPALLASRVGKWFLSTPPKSEPTLPVPPPRQVDSPKERTSAGNQ